MLPDTPEGRHGRGHRDPERQEDQDEADDQEGVEVSALSLAQMPHSRGLSVAHTAAVGEVIEAEAGSAAGEAGGQVHQVVGTTHRVNGGGGAGARGVTLGGGARIGEGGQ